MRAAAASERARWAIREGPPGRGGRSPAGLTVGSVAGGRANTEGGEDAGRSQWWSHWRARGRRWPTVCSRPAAGGSAVSAAQSWDGLLVEHEADRRADRRDDPEAQDDLGLRPGHQLEVVVDRRHQEHAPAEALERDHLDHDRERLDDED